MIFPLKLFDKLRKTQPNYDKKLIPICSDMVKPNLGLSDEDAATLQEDVHIIFHSAATIRFDEKLKWVEMGWGSFDPGRIFTSKLLKYIRSVDLR